METAPQGDSLANNERYAYQEDYLFGLTVPIAAFNSYLLSSPSLH